MKMIKIKLSKLAIMNNFGFIIKKITKAILKFWNCLQTYFCPGGVDIPKSFFKYSTSIEKDQTCFICLPLSLWYLFPAKKKVIIEGVIHLINRIIFSYKSRENKIISWKYSYLKHKKRYLNVVFTIWKVRSFI